MADPSQGTATSAKVPRIFSPGRRLLREARSVERLEHGEDEDPGLFFIEAAVNEMADRLDFVRHEPTQSLVPNKALDKYRARFIKTGNVAAPEGINLEEPFGDSEYDFIGIAGALDAVNDLPGALIHVRNALMPDGLAIICFIGGASLPCLRAAMMAADGDRPAARIHPMVDPRSMPALLQRAGWKHPVVDTHTLKVRYSSLDRLVNDLRDQGLGSALADPGPPLGKAALARARAAFLEGADEDGKVTETFEIITLTGRRSLAGT